MQASSTMNQSDIRGLSLRDKTYVDILDQELCFLQIDFNRRTAYRDNVSHITLIVSAIASANHISSFQVSKNNFGGALIKEIFLSRHLPLFSCLIFY